MDGHTLEALEFGKVVEKIAGFAASEPGREAVRALVPSADAAAVRRRLAKVTEVRRVIEAAGRFPAPALKDVRPHIARAAIQGSSLDPRAILDLADCCAAAKETRDFLLKHCADQPNLKRISGELRVLPGLERSVRAALDDEGNVTDDASEELSEIRSEMRHTEFRIRERLKAILENPASAGWLQESYFTIRDGRHVLPVSANLKAELPGIVHDRSDTGQTVFVEPAETVALGNELRDLKSLERVEINRILANLTAAVREALPDVSANQELLVALDADRAKAEFSLKYGMTEPAVEVDGDYVLYRARHPLLLFAGIEAVPIDVSLTRSARCLVITGPNAGGKTVALKTLGLLALMAQSGLHVPAGERSVFRMFRTVFADIGDYQSIEERMSSFSSHMTRIRSIIDRVDDRTLVLLDELGAATDPDEGGPLSCAVLGEIHRRGAFSVVTTHLSDLKVLAHSTEGMANAATLFDSGTGAPTYQLRTGIPGSSRALETAGRLGFPPAVIAAARGFMSEGKARFEAAVADLEAEIRMTAEERRKHGEELAEAKALKEKYRAHVAAAKKEKREILRKAAAQAADMVLEGRKIVEDAVRRIKEVQAGAGPGGAAEARSAAKDARTRLERKIDDLKSLQSSLAERAPADLSPARIEPGAVVQVKSLKRAGVIASINHRKKKAVVRSGGMEIEADLADLAPAEIPAHDRSPRPDRRFPDLARNAERELVVVGMRVEEALDRVKSYINEALLSDLEEVRIVHGMGTGALRKAVEGFLRAHPSVASIRPGGKGEGGSGATVVRLTE